MDAAVVFSALEDLGFENTSVIKFNLENESDIRMRHPETNHPVDSSHWPATWEEVMQKINEKKFEIALNFLREQRDEKLKQTDQYGLADYPFRSDEHKQAWQDYRQALRDLPANSGEAQIDLETGELTGVVWPTKPTN
jgi:hypothetical protein